MSAFLLFFLFLQILIMMWTDHKNELLLREIIPFEPFIFNPYTKECDNAWNMIAENPNQLDSKQIKTNQRAFYEIFEILKTCFEGKTAEQLKVSGIAAENEELVDALEDVIKKIKEIENLHAEGESA